LLHGNMYLYDVVHLSLSLTHTNTHKDGLTAQ